MTTTTSRFEHLVREQLARQPLPAGVPVRPEDLAHLPAPVRRHVERSGAVGRPRVHNFRIDWEAAMYRKGHYRDRPSLTYGEFVIRDVAYNVTAYRGP
jgi:hypothetical protein